MESRALVDWVAEEGFDRPARAVDDWTAGEDLDFTVRSRRRRITGEHVVEAADASAATSQVVELPLRGAVDPPERRTVVLSAGRPDQPVAAPRLREVQQRRRSTRTPADRARTSPDRIAMWAVAMGFLLIVIASLSS
ncbi:hypothetical protein [Paraconexibacter sp.]|uniref:hypothetical protein n=1 Tax=Paraconexibacter sp. TaxID=2949640 RepID=UPI003561D64C